MYSETQMTNFVKIRFVMWRRIRIFLKNFNTKDFTRLTKAVSTKLPSAQNIDNKQTLQRAKYANTQPADPN
jgi:hypothetical protein